MFLFGQLVWFRKKNNYLLFEELECGLSDDVFKFP